MDLSAPSWDLFVTLFMIIALGYGFLLQRERIVVTIVAAYVGLAITSLFWPALQGFFHGENPLLGKYFVRASFSDSQLQVGLFLLTTLLVSSKAGLDAERGSGWLSPFELVGLSVLSGALILTTILGFLPEANVQTLAEGSRIVTYLVKYHSLLLIAPLVALLVLGWRGRRSSERD